jgi:hypothetical protein
MFGGTDLMLDTNYSLKHLLQILQNLEFTHAM